MKRRGAPPASRPTSVWGLRVSERGASRGRRLALPHEKSAFTVLGQGSGDLPCWKLILVSQTNEHIPLHTKQKPKNTFTASFVKFWMMNSCSEKVDVNLCVFSQGGQYFFSIVG